MGLFLKISRRIHKKGSRTVIRWTILRRTVLRWTIFRTDSSSLDNFSAGQFFAGQFFAQKTGKTVIFEFSNRVFFEKKGLN
jgi:hypothetical protein